MGLDTQPAIATRLMSEFAEANRLIVRLHKIREGTFGLTPSRSATFLSSSSELATSNIAAAQQS